MAVIRPNDVVLDHSEVQFFLRRLVHKATEMFHHFHDVTKGFVESRGEGASALETYWRTNLPSIALWNTLVQRALADEFKADVSNIDASADFTYLLYCRSNYGSDAHGNVNILRVVKPPFYELFHTFLVRLACAPEMTRMAALLCQDDMERACRNALCDALHDVSVPRVSITETMSPSKWRAYKRDRDNDGSAAYKRDRDNDGSAAATKTDFPSAVPAFSASLASPVAEELDTATDQGSLVVVDHRQTKYSPNGGMLTAADGHVTPSKALQDAERIRTFKDTTQNRQVEHERKHDQAGLDWDCRSQASTICDDAWKKSLAAKTSLHHNDHKYGTSLHYNDHKYGTSRVTSDDSSSQIHSLGIRHQRAIKRGQTMKVDATTTTTSSLDKWRMHEDVAGTGRRVPEDEELGTLGARRSDEGLGTLGTARRRDEGLSTLGARRRVPEDEGLTTPVGTRRRVAVTLAERQPFKEPERSGYSVSDVDADEYDQESDNDY